VLLIIFQSTPHDTATRLALLTSITSHNVVSICTHFALALALAPSLPLVYVSIEILGLPGLHNPAS
jgi:hypothetical protein